MSPRFIDNSSRKFFRVAVVLVFALGLLVLANLPSRRHFMAHEQPSHRYSRGHQALQPESLH